MRWMRWHCPPDTGFKIRALAVLGRARYLSVTKAPHNTEFYTWMVLTRQVHVACPVWCGQHALVDSVQFGQWGMDCQLSGQLPRHNFSVNQPLGRLPEGHIWLPGGAAWESYYDKANYLPIPGMSIPQKKSAGHDHRGEDVCITQKTLPEHRADTWGCWHDALTASSTKLRSLISLSQTNRQTNKFMLQSRN